MPKIEIYFAGLICHIGPSSDEGSDRSRLIKSVLLDDGNYHTARILTSYQASVGPPTEPTYFLGDVLYTDVFFTNLGYEAVAEALFSDTVPHLDDLTRAGTKGYPDPPGLSVHLPSGKLTVVEFYKYGAKWRIDGDVNIRPCVPRVTMLSTGGGSVSVDFNDQNLSIKKDGWILITNIETQPPPPYYEPGDDWKKQYRSTTGKADDLADWYELPGRNDTPPKPTCKEKQPARGRWTDDVLKILDDPRLTDSSECTNSHWP